MGSRMQGKAAMRIQQLTVKELTLADATLRNGGSPTDAWRAINAKRVEAQIRQVGKGAVHRYVKGSTHKRGAVERRGRKGQLTKQDVRRLDLTRRRLVKRADNAVRVTYADVVKEAGLEGAACQRVLEDALRAIGVTFKPPRRKIQITDDDAKLRFRVAKVWVKRPAKYWRCHVHAYVDNKAFPIPLTPQQKLRLRQRMITGHLRKASEGLDRGFTKPREKHAFVGLPSVTVSAAVAKDRVIIWHVVEGQWNGAAAAEMYERHLKPALARTWGKRSRYTIVEDGDRKGNASGKGVAAKTRANIYPLTLPPRTPSLMPLD